MRNSVQAKGVRGPATPDREGDRLASPRLAGLLFLGQPLGDQETALIMLSHTCDNPRSPCGPKTLHPRMNLFFNGRDPSAPQLTADRPTPVWNRIGVVLNSVPVEARTDHRLLGRRGREGERRGGFRHTMGQRAQGRRPRRREPALEALFRRPGEARPATASRDLPAPADEEDVALSAFDSLCRGAVEGRFPRLDDRNDLWRCWSPSPPARPPTWSGSRRGSSGAGRPGLAEADLASSGMAAGGLAQARTRAEPRSGGPPRRRMSPLLRPAPRRVVPASRGASSSRDTPTARSPRGLLRSEHRRAAAQDGPDLMGGVELRLDLRHGSES